MDNQELVVALREAGDTLAARCFPPNVESLVREAADAIERLQTGRTCMTVSVSLSDEQMRNAIESAFENVTGKGFQYVMEAVKEKMLREGELDVEEETEDQTGNSEQA